ncbi:MAG TPA: anthranilate synthase component I family protein [Chitinophagaceae bacterium]|nr:anthranilate synthase component I family protein [Chitinophagaceae bacterium]
MKNKSSTNCTFRVSDFEATKDKVLNWAKQFSTFCFLDNHQYQIEPHSVECLLAAGQKRMISSIAGSALHELEQFLDERKSWLFGHLSYDLKNEIENISSRHVDQVGFPDLFFFEPEILIRLSADEVCIEADDALAVFEKIENYVNNSLPVTGSFQVKNRISKSQYVDYVRQLQKHIARGDCYEVNYCQEFFAEGAIIDPLHVYKRLSETSPNPFSALYRVHDKWLICASPERFLKRNGSSVISQPIKGTSRRAIDNVFTDELNKQTLYNSRKDRSENVMVVDLVRNDLAKVCREGTVKVDELFGIYSFPQVHQMISTVSGELKPYIRFEEIIRAAFPMGSMTGAPKRRVMELIEQYEQTKRGIFSGAVGYITPDGDFDFNVVIRSIMYNETSKYLSFQAGSGITFYSEAEQEWEECLLKAEAIKRVLENY